MLHDSSPLMPKRPEPQFVGGISVRHEMDLLVGLGTLVIAPSN